MDQDTCMFPTDIDMDEVEARTMHRLSRQVREASFGQASSQIICGLRQKVYRLLEEKKRCDEVVIKIMEDSLEEGHQFGEEARELFEDVKRYRTRWLIASQERDRFRDDLIKCKNQEAIKPNVLILSSGERPSIIETLKEIQKALDPEGSRVLQRIIYGLS